MRLPVVSLLAPAVLAAASAHAQVELSPVDPGVADVSPLGASLRSLLSDLRTPVGFDRVYGVDGRHDVWVRSSGALHAVFPRSWYDPGPDGAMDAVVPAGTTFRIGRDALEAALAAPPFHGPIVETGTPVGRLAATPWGGPVQRAPLRAEPIQRPLDMTAGRPEPSTAGVETRAEVRRMIMAAGARDDVDGTDDPSVKGPPILVDVDYRHRRLRELMRRAADAQAARGPSSS